MRKNRAKPFWVLILLLSFFNIAMADVWGFVDQDGTTHVAAERVDERYSLFYRAPQKTVREPVVATAATSVSQPVLSPRLADFFESSPRYRQLQPLLRETARVYRIDYELLKALIATESAFNASAVSSKGAIGLMQVMPDTARRFGLESDRWVSIESKLADPIINLKTGARYLRFLMDMFPGQLDLALASYNAGEGAVQKAGNKIPNFKETQAYVVMVKQIYSALKPVATPVHSVASKPRAEPYGAGYVLNSPTQPYQLNLPGGAKGRSNMMPSIQANAEPGLPEAND
jgi:hypothetical protein